MSLTRKAISSNSFTFANGFNHNLLKERFTMMIRRQSNKWSRATASYLLPVSAVAVWAFATPAFSSGTSFFNDDAMYNPNDTVPQTPVTVSDSIGDQVYAECESMPEFPGGPNALMAYLGKNMKYPVEAQVLGLSGTIIVEFVVLKDGSIGNTRIARNGIKIPAMTDAQTKSMSQKKLTKLKTMQTEAIQSLEQEAIRVVMEMPKWKPGIQKGKAVNVKYMLPIGFRLK